MRDISIKQLRAFLSVAATQNFSQAAAKLHISPSALSLSIQELEGRIGLKLFNRSTRSVALTDTGAAFLPVADRLVSDFVRAIDDLVAFPAQERGRVVLGAAASVITIVLGRAIADLYKVNNRIDVRLIEDTTQNLYKQGCARRAGFRNHHALDQDRFPDCRSVSRRPSGDYRRAQPSARQEQHPDPVEGSARP